MQNGHLSTCIFDMKPCFKQYCLRFVGVALSIVCLSLELKLGDRKSTLSHLQNLISEFGKKLRKLQPRKPESSVSTFLRCNAPLHMWLQKQRTIWKWFSLKYIVIYGDAPSSNKGNIKGDLLGAVKMALLLRDLLFL